MEVRVRFRFNKLTGEVETFTVEDEQTTQPLSETEHNRHHDEVAAEIGRVVERNPRVREITGGLTPVAEQLPQSPTPEANDRPEESPSGRHSYGS